MLLDAGSTWFERSAERRRGVHPTVHFLVARNLIPRYDMLG